MEGTVKRWVNGYGFMEPDEGGEDVSIHHTDLNGASVLRQGRKPSSTSKRRRRGYERST